MDLIVTETPLGVEPIDSVQVLFDEYMSNSPPIALYGFTSNFLTAYFTNASINSDRWSWDFGDGTGSNLQNPTHVYASSGTYTVCLTAYNGCVANTILVTVNVTAPASVEQNDMNSKIVVYPNPGNGSYTILVESELLGCTIKIYDEAGKLVKEIVEVSMREILLDLSPFAKGAYKMNVVKDDLGFSKTIIYQ